MKKIIFYISCCLVICYSSHASVLQFSDNTSSKLFEKSLRDTSLHSIDSLQLYFVNQGYLDVAISQSSDSLFITTGKLYSLGAIYLDSLKLTSDHLQKSFTQEALQIEIDFILDKEREIGFQFATVRIESTVVNLSSVDIYCTLNKGPQALFENLKFEGLTKTNSLLLGKYFNVIDTLITPKLLQEVEKDASNIPFVKFIPPLKQELNYGYTSVNLIVPFQEKDNLLFEAGGGYISETDLFVWNVSLNFQNLFGAGRQISIRSQKKDMNHQYLALNYEQPLFLFGVGLVDMTIQTRDYREQFYEFIVGSQIQSYYKRKINIGFESQYKTVEQENNQSYSATQLSLSIHNKKLVPLFILNNKFLYDWKFSYGRRKYKSDINSVAVSHSSFNESRIEINSQIYKTLISPMTILLEMNFKSYQTDEDLPPYAELFLIGGSNSIRGFKDEQFPSIRNFTFTFEPQYQFDSGNIFFFYDGGYIYNRTVSESSEFDENTIYRYGYGGGISLLNNSTALKLSVGWNKNLTFDNPRISIQLKTGL